MIFNGTNLKVVDNSGALKVRCIKVLKKHPKTPANHGDHIIVVVKNSIPHKRVTKHQIHHAIVIWSTRNKRRKEGTYIKIASPACVILKKDGLPVASRVRGIVYRELRPLGHLRLVSISKIAI